MSKCVVGQCVLPTYLGLGASCGDTKDSDNVWCGDGTWCHEHVCVERPRLGQHCSSGGPPCHDGSECWKGVCELPNPDYCPASGEITTLP